MSLSSDSSLALGRISTSRTFSVWYQFSLRIVPAFKACVHFLMGQSMIQSSQIHATKYPKTILFIDWKTKVANVAQALIDRHVLIGYSPPQASSVVEEFRSFTLSHNKDRFSTNSERLIQISGYWWPWAMNEFAWDWARGGVQSLDHYGLERSNAANCAGRDGWSYGGYNCFSAILGLWRR